MAHVLCIYICILSRNNGSSRVFQINMVSELAILAKAASGAERSARTPGGGRAGAGDQLAALAPPLRDAEEERAVLGSASRQRGRRSSAPRWRRRARRGRGARRRRWRRWLR